MSDDNDEIFIDTKRKSDVYLAYSRGQFLLKHNIRILAIVDFEDVHLYNIELDDSIVKDKDKLVYDAIDKGFDGAKKLLCEDVFDYFVDFHKEGG